MDLCAFHCINAQYWTFYKTNRHFVVLRFEYNSATIHISSQQLGSSVPQIKYPLRQSTIHKKTTRHTTLLMPSNTFHDYMPNNWWHAVANCRIVHCVFCTCLVCPSPISSVLFFFRIPNFKQINFEGALMLAQTMRSRTQHGHRYSQRWLEIHLNFSQCEQTMARHCFSCLLWSLFAFLLVRFYSLPIKHMIYLMRFVDGTC